MVTDFSEQLLVVLFFSEGQVTRAAFYDVNQLVPELRVQNPRTLRTYC